MPEGRYVMSDSSRASSMPYYWRLSSFYFLYFALLGTLVPYWSLYLNDLGFSAFAIGALMAIPQLTKLGAPNVWGWLADRSGRRLGVIRAGNLLAAVAFLPVFWVDAVWPMAMMLLCFSMFWNAVLAQFEVLTLNTLGRQAKRYSLVRLWGSVGFIVAVLVVGALLEQFDTALLPWVMSGLLWLLWLGTQLLPPDTPQAHIKKAHHQGGMFALLARKDMQVFLCAAFFMQLSHGPYYAFYSLYLDSLGVSQFSVGALWALGVLAEVVLFLVMHRVMARLSLHRILIGSLLLAALRWLMIGWADGNMLVLLIAQCLHAATFGSFHAACIAWVHQHVGAAQAGQGQALYSSLGFGAGWAVGAGLSGLLWDQYGADLFIAAAAFAALAAFLLAFNRNMLSATAGGEEESRTR